MKNLRKKIEDALVAITFAEAGESKVAREILKEGEQPHRRILLGIDDLKPNKKPLLYAANLCKRIDAGLEILYILNPRRNVTLWQLEELKNRLNPILFELKKEGIGYKVTFRTGYLTEEIIRYIKSRKEIFFVVIGSPKKIDFTEKYRGEMLSKECNRLGFPLVVVSPRGVAA